MRNLAVAFLSIVLLSPPLSEIETGAQDFPDELPLPWTIFVFNPELSLSAMLEKYTEIDPRIPLMAPYKGLPPEDPKTLQGITLTLNEPASSKRVIELLGIENARPATLQELLSYGINGGSEKDTVTLGSTVREDSAYFFPILPRTVDPQFEDHGYFLDLKIGAIAEPTLWPIGTVFLGVRRPDTASRRMLHASGGFIYFIL